MQNKYTPLSFIIRAYYGKLDRSPAAEQYLKDRMVYESTKWPNELQDLRRTAGRFPDFKNMMMRKFKIPEHIIDSARERAIDTYEYEMGIEVAL